MPLGSAQIEASFEVSRMDANVSETRSPRREILLAEGLKKAYGRRQALHELSFSLQSGRVLGFLGPNGAGKTTSIRILTTILEPDSGSFYVDGVSHTQANRVRQRIGVLPESLGFPKQVSGAEFLAYFSQLYGRGSKEARKNAGALLEEVGMTARARSPIGSYSRGMRQRLGIARALVNNPVVVFLDEPTLGLDPRGQQELLELIRRIARERGVGIILCSHMLSEIEVVCDDVLILNRGQVVVRGPVTEVIGQVNRAAHGLRILRIQVSPEFAEAAVEKLQACPLVRQAERTAGDAGWLRVELESPNGNEASAEQPVNNQILEVLIQNRIPIMSLEAEGGRLQDVFFQLTEETIQ